MAVRAIRIMGDPVLHAPAGEVAEITDEVRALVADMFETMDAAPGVGLAAPQVGVPLRIFTYNYEDDEGRPWRGVVLNPELWMAPTVPGEPDPDEESEGCLSFPGERFPLRRSDRVRLTGQDLDGRVVELEVDGWRARILQHEFDHLDGVLYVDRLDDGDWKTVQKIARKRGWGRPGASWMPGVDDIDA
jgi:peptide deformylase